MKQSATISPHVGRVNPAIMLLYNDSRYKSRDAQRFLESYTRPSCYKGALDRTIGITESEKGYRTKCLFTCVPKHMKLDNGGTV